LKQTKLNVDVIEIDSKDTTTEELKKCPWQTIKLNTNINATTNNEDIMNTLKLLKQKLSLILYNCQNCRIHSFDS
jgi:hypothetical protein